MARPAAGSPRRLQRDAHEPVGKRLRRRHPQRPRARWRRQSLDRRGRRHQERPLRQDRSHQGARQERDRRRRQVRDTGLHRRDGPVRGPAAEERPGGEQGPHGRDLGDRRRRRLPEPRWRTDPARGHRRLLRRARAPGHLDELRHLLRRNAGARGGDGRRRRQAHRRADGADEGPRRPRDAGRRLRHHHRADLSALLLPDHRGADRARKSRVEVQGHLRQPHPRRGKGPAQGAERGGRDRRERRRAGRGVPPQGRVRAGLGPDHAQGREPDRGRARPRREHRRRHVRVSRRRHRPGRHRAQLGVRRRLRQGHREAERPEAARAPQEGSRGRLAARLVEPGRGLRRLGAHRARRPARRAVPSSTRARASPTSARR